MFCSQKALDIIDWSNISAVSRVFAMSNRIALFKNALRKTTFPVMVVTTGVQSGSNGLRLQGATISSLTSLSVNPIPLLQFNLGVPSTTSQLLRTAGLFAVHILHADKDCVSLAKRFSQGVKSILTTPFGNLTYGEEYTLYTPRDTSNTAILPILRGVKDVLICSTRSIIEVEDHEIWVGEVIDSLSHNGLDITSDNMKNPSRIVTGGGLLHHNGHFHRIGGPIDEEKE